MNRIVYIIALLLCAYGVRTEVPNTETLIVYGDRYGTTGGFLRDAAKVRRVWNEYIESSGMDRTRCGFLMIRNAQRTVEVTTTDTRFVRDLATRTYRMPEARIVVISNRMGRMEPDGIDLLQGEAWPPIVFITPTQINYLRHWFETGQMEDAK